jgi:trans-2,3-dihydro-3-hydroxyanthranilate isomerase
MARSYRYLHLDVFTDRLFGGNQLAVVLDGRGLTTDTMQAIAKEMNFSETTFVLPPETAGTDARMRIFTPGAELPIAGHPTIGSTFALARSGVIAPGREQFVFGLGAGPTPVSLTWRADDLTFAWMTQPLPVFGEPIADPAAAASVVGLPAGALDGRGAPVQVVSCGAPFLFLPLGTRGEVDRASTSSSELERFFRASGVDAHGVFLFSTETAADGATAYSRMFAPAFGVFEDPATGIASGPLGSYLVRYGLVDSSRAKAMLSLQGVKMGRPSHVHISIDGDRRAITGVRVGGQSVLAGEGTLYL